MGCLRLHTNYTTDLTLVYVNKNLSLLKTKNLALSTSIYGFNGKENDPETGTQDYGFRIYNPNLGKFLSVDPLTMSYPWYSPYQFAGNNPILFIDMDGSEPKEPDKTNNNNQPKPRKLTSAEVKAIKDFVNNGFVPVVPVPLVTEQNKTNISTVSWGETSGIFPTKDNLYNPAKWDKEKLKELQKARAGIIEVEKRNSDVNNASPNMADPLTKKLAAFHLKDNIPEADPEIKNDADVTFFYLASTADTKTPSISTKYYDQKTVKAYGPFYNAGGGDAKKGDIFIIFYKPIAKANTKTEPAPAVKTP